MRTVGSTRGLHAAVTIGLLVEGVAVFGDLIQRVQSAPEVGGPAPSYGKAAAGFSHEYLNDSVVRDGAPRGERSHEFTATTRVEPPSTPLEATRSGQKEVELDMTAEEDSDNSALRVTGGRTGTPEANVVAEDPGFAPSTDPAEIAHSDYPGARRGAHRKNAVYHTAESSVFERAAQRDDSGSQPVVPPCSGGVATKGLRPPTSAAPRPAAYESAPDTSQTMAYVLKLQGRGAVEVSFEVGRAIKQQESARKACRDASARLEAEEAASAAEDVSAKRLLDFIKDNKKRVTTSLQQSKIKKLDEIDELLQLSRALRELDDRLTACEGLSAIEDVACERSSLFGKIVEQKAKDIRGQASVLSSFLGREAIEPQLGCSGERTDSDRVEVRARELQQALVNAAAEARKFVQDVAGDVGGNVREEVQNLHQEAKDILVRAQQAVIEAYRYVQRSLLEEKAKELIDTASTKIDDARKISAE